MALRNPFLTDSVETPVFFWSTTFICAFEILCHLTPASPVYITVLVAALGLLVLSQGLHCGIRVLSGRRPPRSWYMPQYRVMATYSFIATFTVVCSTGNSCILYLPIIVGLCFKSFGYIVRSWYIRTLGTVMLFSTLALSILRSVLSGFDPTLFLLAYAVSVFADLLIGSLDEVHRKYTAAVEDKAEAIKSVHGLMMEAVRTTVKDKLEDLQVLATEEYRSNKFLFIMTLGRHTGYIGQVLDSSEFSARTRDPLQQILSQELSKEYSIPLSVDYRGMSVITSVGYHKLYLSMVLSGVLEGACNIAEHNGVGMLRVSVNIGPYGVVLEDNSGEVPPGVRLVVRDKFLRTVSDPAVRKLFGMTMHVEQGLNGYRYIITLVD